MLLIAIVDDERSDSSALKALVDTYFQQNRQAYMIHVFNGALDFIRSTENHDIVFMDIRMDKLDGLEVARIMRKINTDSVLIFVTHMAQLAIKGYEVDALDFIVKPADQGSINYVLDKAMKRLEGVSNAAFGGNAMPGIASKKAISFYVRKIVMQFDYFKEVAPEAQLMFIGPADMCKSEDGNLITWPLLPQLNDSLKVNCLKNGVAYWDTFNVMGGPGSMRKWVSHNPALAGPDHIHFTHKGALEIGNALAKSFILYHDFYKLRQELSDEAVGIYLRDLRDSLNPRPAVPDTLTKIEL